MDKSYENFLKNAPTSDLLNNLNHHSRWGELEAVKYISNIPQVKNNVGYFLNQYSPLISASSQGQLEVLKYFLTSMELDFKPIYPLILSVACSNQHKPIIEYLLYSPELKKHANIHHNKDQIFRDACVTDLDMVQYLIFDLNIKKTDRIETFLKHLKINPPDRAKEIMDMFEKRELIQSLQVELNKNNNLPSSKKTKI
jgi:hypothetical protein